MMNCNPETVSTDYDTSSRLYFEPITGGAQLLLLLLVVVTLLLELMACVEHVLLAGL
jgi:carbamoylphosphate synthase large subunit